MQGPHLYTLMSTRSPENGFVSTWKTDNVGTSNDDQITLPLEASGDYDFTVWWGDDTKDKITVWNQAEVTHTYPSAGTYTVSILGTINGWRFNMGGDRLKILTIEKWSQLKLGNNQDYFYGCTQLQINATDIPDLSDTTDLSGLFTSCTGITSLDIDDWDVSGVTNMSYSFQGCVSLTALDINSWDVSNVTNMTGTFRSLVGLTSLNVSSWDVSGVETFYRTFNGCTSLVTTDISLWDVGASVSFKEMFRGCNAMTTLDVSGWDTSSVTNMSSMFFDCWDLTSVDVSLWDVGLVTNMDGMFLFCTSISNPDVSSWNTVSLGSAGFMFMESAVTSVAVDLWDITSVAYLQDMFFNSDLTTAKYDQILLAWSIQLVLDSVMFGVASTKYTGGGAVAAARAVLVGAPNNWDISDGGTA